MGDEELKRKMVAEADIILESIAWAEKHLNTKFEELEVARKNFLLSEEEIKEKEIRTLLFRLQKEIDLMDKFLVKYSVFITGSL